MKQENKIVLGITCFGILLISVLALDYFGIYDIPGIELAAVPGKEVELVYQEMCAKYGCSGGCIFTGEFICPTGYDYCELWFKKRNWKQDETPLNEVPYESLAAVGAQLKDTCGVAQECSYEAMSKTADECWDFVGYGVNPTPYVCKKGEKRCSGITLQKCNVDLNDWVDEKDCEYGCYQSATSTGARWAECNDCLAHTEPWCKDGFSLTCEDSGTKWEAIYDPCGDYGCNPSTGLCNPRPDCIEGVDEPYCDGDYVWYCSDGNWVKAVAPCAYKCRDGECISFCDENDCPDYCENGIEYKEGSCYEDSYGGGHCEYLVERSCEGRGCIDSRCREPCEGKSSQSYCKEIGDYWYWYHDPECDDVLDRYVFTETQCPYGCTPSGCTEMCYYSSDCEGRGYEHDDCKGRWTCENSVCIWICEEISLSFVESGELQFVKEDIEIPVRVDGGKPNQLVEGRIYTFPEGISTGPKESATKDDDGIATLEFSPLEAGDYEIKVRTWDETKNDYTDYEVDRFVVSGKIHVIISKLFDPQSNARPIEAVITIEVEGDPIKRDPSPVFDITAKWVDGGTISYNNIDRIKTTAGEWTVYVTVEDTGFLNVSVEVDDYEFGKAEDYVVIKVEGGQIEINPPDVCMKDYTDLCIPLKAEAPTTELITIYTYIAGDRRDVDTLKVDIDDPNGISYDILTIKNGKLKEAGEGIYTGTVSWDERVTKGAYTYYIVATKGDMQGEIVDSTYVDVKEEPIIDWWLIIGGIAILIIALLVGWKLRRRKRKKK